MLSGDVEMLLSIVTVTLNDEIGLSATLDSIKGILDCRSDVEHLVIDGLSDYDVAGLVDVKCSKSRLIQGKDDGIYDAMNRGLSISSGKYVIFINSGDLFVWGDLLRENSLLGWNSDIVYFDAFEETVAGLVAKVAGRHDGFRKGMFTHHQAMAFRRGFLTEHDLWYDQSLKIAGDWELVVRMMLLKARAEYMPFPICVFERGGVSQRNRAISRAEVFAIRKKYFGLMSAVSRRFLQDLAWWLRGYDEGLYWKLRSVFLAQR